MNYVKRHRNYYGKKEIAERTQAMEERHPGYTDRILWLKFLVNAIIVYRIIFVAYSYMFVVSLSSAMDLVMPAAEIFMAWGWLHLILYTRSAVLAFLMVAGQITSFFGSISYLGSIIFYHPFLTAYVVMYIGLCVAVVIFLIYIFFQKSARNTVRDHVFVVSGGPFVARSTMEAVHREMELLKMQDEMGEGTE